MTAAAMIVLLLLNLAVLLHINHKIPKRNYAKEALEWDRQQSEGRNEDA
ncbi:hypothetical protein ACTHPF_02645 [Paenibacillus sp. SAF-054]